MNRAILKQRIAEQGFSTRAYNCLRMTGIETVEDLVTRERINLLCTVGLGRKSLGEIDDFLNKNGLRLGMKKKELYPSVEEAPAYFTGKHAVNMKLRDYFAAKALTGIISRFPHNPPTAWVRDAYELADLMLERRREDG